MKAIARISALCICALLLVVGETTVGQQKSPYKPKAQAQKPPAWEPFGEGVEVIRLFDVNNRVETEPEIAILRLSDAKYAEFNKNRIGFLNKLGIYSKPLLSGLGDCPQKKYEVTRRTIPDGHKWIVAEPHWPDSCAEFAAFYPAQFPKLKTSAPSKQ